MHAWANIGKTKSVSGTLAIIFLIAALLLNAGLLVVVNYGNFFESLKEELLPADAYYCMSDILYTEEVKSYLDGNEHVQKVQAHDVRWLSTQIIYQGKEQSFAVLFNDMDEPREMCKWKIVENGSSNGRGAMPGVKDAPMPVYVPDIFKAVGGYQLGDPIELKYTEAQTGGEKTLAFTVQGYTEDIFFSSIDVGFVSFYLPGETYQEVADILNDPLYKAHVVFTNVDDINNVAVIEGGIQEILGLNSASLVAVDFSALFAAVDLSLIEMARCMMANMVAAMMVVFALVLVVVCLLVVRFRIVNSLEEDVVNIGSLKSMGYTSQQIILSVILQFCLIAGAGSLAGIALSYPALPAVSMVFEQQSGLKWEQGFDGGVSSAAFLAIELIVVSVAWLSARHIGKLSPVSALRMETSARKYSRNYLPLEGAASVASESRLPMLLALKSVVHNMKQTVMIVTILIAVTFVGAYGVIMYYNTSVDTKAFAEVPGMEICNAIAMLNPGLDQTQAVQAIEGMDAVRKGQYLDEVKLRVEGTDVAAVVMETYAGKESMLVYEGRYPLSDHEIVLAGILAERLHKTVGDTVAVGFGDQEEVFNVVGLSNGSSMGGLNTSILTRDFLRFNPDFKHQSLYIYLAKGTDAAGFIEDLETVFKDRFEDQADQKMLLGTVNFDKELASGMASYQSIVAAMGLVMLVITGCVVALVLYFVISSSVIRKRRELGIQKAIGFTTFQLMNQISIGFMLPIFVGAAVGSVLGAYYTNPLMSVVMRGMGVMKAGFIVDPYWVVAFGAATVVASYLLSLLISWRIRKISAYALVAE